MTSCSRRADDSHDPPSAGPTTPTPASLIRLLGQLAQAAGQAASSRVRAASVLVSPAHVDERVRAQACPSIREPTLAQDNVRVALRWSLDAQRATEGLGLLRALGPLWLVRGVPADGYRWVETMLQLSDRTSEAVSPASRAQAFMFGAIIAFGQSARPRTTVSCLVGESCLHTCTVYQDCDDQQQKRIERLLDLHPGRKQIWNGHEHNADNRDYDRHDPQPTASPAHRHWHVVAISWKIATAIVRPWVINATP
jgi:hypothetical protein